MVNWKKNSQNMIRNLKNYENNRLQKLSKKFEFN